MKAPAYLRFISKVLETISVGLAARYAARLFTTPIRHKTPKRELKMLAQSKQVVHYISEIDRKVMTYELGNGKNKVLLVHGWSGRGTQLFKFADALLQADYQVISFDAPAHGKSEGTTTIMPEFIAVIKYLVQIYGPCTAAIGHSLGGMSLLNAVSRETAIEKVVTIGSANIIQDIIDDFTCKIGLTSRVSVAMRTLFEKRRNETMDAFSSQVAARGIDIPVLVIHDEKDDEVPVKCAREIYQNLKKGELMLTHGLGHRKILGDQSIIAHTLKFITDENNSARHTAALTAVP